MKKLLFAIPLLSAALLTGTETPAAPKGTFKPAEEALPAEATRPAALPPDVQRTVGEALAEAAHAVAVGADLAADSDDLSLLLEPEPLPLPKAAPAKTSQQDTVSRPAVSQKTPSVTKAAVKPAVKPAAASEKKPAAKPDAKPTVKPMVKPTANPEVKPTAKTEAKPVPKTVVKAEVKPAAKPETKPTAKTELKPAATPVAKAEVKTVAKPDAKPTVKAETKPAKKPETKPAAKTELKSIATPVAKANTKPEAKPAAVPVAKANAKPEAKSAAKPEAKSAATPEVTPATKPETKPVAKAEAKPAVKSAAKAEAKTVATPEATPAAKPEAAPAAAAKPAARPVAPSDSAAEKKPVAPETAAKTAAIRWKVPRYSLIARGMPLHEAFQTFGSAQGMSVLMTPAVVGAFSGEFRDMPAAEFLDRITALHNLLWYFDGAALYICGSGEVQTMLLSLRYMKVDEVRATLRELGVEDERFPIRTAANGEMMLVSGPPRYVSIVADTIAKADTLREQRTFNEVETRIFPLKHTWADDVTLNVTGPESSGTIRGVAGMLREIMNESSGNRVRERTGRKEPSATAPDGDAAPEAEADDTLNAAMTDAFRPIIKPDNRLNTVIVRDVATRMPMYERLIRQLDKPQQLVEIGVTVVELSREDALDWQLSLKVEGAHEEFQGAAGQNAGNLLKDVGGRGLAGTASYLGEDVTVSGSLTALKDKGKTRSISRTSLLTLNNFAAQLSDMQSYHARVVGTEVASLEEVSAGTHLQIKPRIIRSEAPDTPDRVWMTMQLQDGGFESVAVDSMPVTRTSTLETQASVQVGHSLLLAGYLRDIKEDAGWGIPYLRDIPWIGWLFGGATYKTETVQRLFILTPYIIDADAPDVTRAQAARQRDIAHEMTLESDSDADHLDRREREAQIREQQDIREEREEERHLRNNEERDFRREQRRDVRWEDRERWEADFDRRRRDYAGERDLRHAAVKEELKALRRETAEREKALRQKQDND